MADLIDRTVLRFSHVINDDGKVYVPLTEVFHAPTVDISPVAKAHWVRCKGNSDLWYCSCCKTTVRYNPNPKMYKYMRQKKVISDYHKFCRHCGSRMDEKDGDSDG